MFLFAGLAAMVAGVGAGADVTLLEKLWPGLHDSTEQTVVNSDRGLMGWTEGVEHRVRTVVAPVRVPWLGPNVLYLEEFYQDEPDRLRRQLLLQLQRQGPPEAAVRVHLFSFVRPLEWSHLDRRPTVASTLQQSDVLENSGCDLVLAKDGDQFIGGTIGHACADSSGGGDRYVDYQLVIGPDIYWYHRRVLTLKGDDLQEEVIGYNWFELNEATLFTCRIDWSPTGKARDLKPLQRLDLRDEGGRAQFSTPDGRTLDLVLHSQDWPFLGERDALILMVQEERRPQPTTVGSAWSEIDTQNISLQLDWLRVRCGPLVPDTDELSGALLRPEEGDPAVGQRALRRPPPGRTPPSAPESRYPAAAPG
jgi:hypothetical protein